jgi:hypothetical protein
LSREEKEKIQDKSKSTKSPGGTKTHGRFFVMPINPEVPAERNETSFKNAQKPESKLKKTEAGKS